MRRPPERSIFTVPRPDPSRILQNLHALQPPRPLLARPIMQHPPAPSPALAGSAEVRLLAAPSPASSSSAASPYNHPPTPSPSSIAYNSGGDDGSSAALVSPSVSSAPSSADKEKEKALVILCFDITRWSARLQLLSLSFGIFFFFLINGYVEEYMFKRLPSFKFGACLVLSCTLSPCFLQLTCPPDACSTCFM